MLSRRRSSLTMPPKRPSTEIDQTIIKQGCLIKSPPLYIFSNRTSWKGRLFKLCKTALDVYYIRYYAYDGVTEDWKGDIAVNDIKSIEVGSDAMDKIPTITRLFSNNPENVLCIKTNRRDYYLMDEKEENIKDWHTCITDVWVKINQKENVDGPRIGLPGLVTALLEPPQARLPREFRGLGVYPIQSRQAAALHVPSQPFKKHAVTMEDPTRPKSFPDESLRPAAALDTEERQRSLTDPETRRGIPARKPELFFENPLENLYEMKRRISQDTAYNSDPDSIYDIPRPMSMSKPFSMDSNEDESDLDDSDENVYQKMDQGMQLSFEEEKNIMDSPSETQNLPDLPERLCVQEQKNCFPQKPPRRPEFNDPKRLSESQGSQLKKAYILKMMYEQDSSNLEVHLTIPTAHLEKYLKLQEVGERLCVSKWKGPVDIGCVFCHGDHIEEINGFRPLSSHFFFQLLERCTKDKVNLVVIRNRKAGVFHVEGCNCGNL
ncbi:pleckstrin homology domain-containing family S member 1 isoform 3-T3 [Mantella aurantiaca]